MKNKKSKDIKNIAKKIETKLTKAQLRAVKNREVAYSTSTDSKATKKHF